MSVLSRIVAPLVWLWGVVYAGFDKLDDVLVWFARPFGVHVRSPLRRYGTLLGIYAIIYLVGALPVPVLPLIALGIGYVGILAIGRAWVKNEKQRTAISKRLIDGDPDALPDLRWTALVSALQLMVLFPLGFWQVHRHFPGLYTVPEDATFWTWLVFTVEAYNNVLLSVFSLYGVQFETAKPASPWGRHLVLVSRLTIEWLLIQGVFRLLAIRETINDAVTAVIRDPALAVCVGRRTVGPLVRVLSQGDAIARLRAAEVLGRLRDEQAIDPLIAALKKDADEGVRAAAAQALGALKANKAAAPLIAALDTPAGELGRQAAAALGQIGDPRAVPALLAALTSEDAGTRAEAAKVLVALGDETAPDYLLQLVVSDPDAEVRRAATAALKTRWLDRAVAGLVEVLEGKQEQAGWWGKLFGTKPSRQEADQAINERWHAAEALGELADSRAVEALVEALEAPDRLVRRAAVVSLGEIGGPAVVEPLLRGLKDRERDVRRQAAKALGEIGDPRAVEPLLEAWQQDREAEVRLIAGHAAQRIDAEAARQAGVD